jgi:DNA-binding NtrC family response regulator
LPTILYVDDERAFLDMFDRLFGEKFELLTADSGPAALAILERQPVAVVISDHRMEPMTGIDLLATVEQRWPLTTRMLLTAFSDREVLLNAINRGRVHDFLLKPANTEDLELRLRHGIDEHLRRAELTNAALERDRLREDPDRMAGHGEIVGLETGLNEAAMMADRIAATDSTVIIRGENGTGKELFARRVHARSGRNKGPFVAVNCAAFPETLVESELFGHEKWAFTNAERPRVGRFEQAHRGTLFLDEIGDVPANVQVKLLRVLETRSVERLGGTRSIDVDFRLITATHQPLEELVDEGGFREDLFHRLNVSQLWLPPLRERQHDIDTLAGHFVDRFSRQYGKRLTLEASALELLRRHSWPGNVRELRNVIERATVAAPREAALGERDISIGPRPRPARAETAAAPATPAPASGPIDAEALMDQIERDMAEEIRDALVRAKGKQSVAARLMGVPRSTFVDRMMRLGVKLKEPR